MKRSEINAALKRMESFMKELKVSLPPFCNFTPEEWKSKGHEYDEIRDNMLGWDITDYGLGDFKKVGFSLITLRNGNQKMQDKYKKPYAIEMSTGIHKFIVSDTIDIYDVINQADGLLYQEKIRKKSGRI